MQPTVRCHPLVVGLHDATTGQLPVDHYDVAVPRRGSPYDSRYERDRRALLDGGCRARCAWSATGAANSADHDPPLAVHKHVGGRAAAASARRACAASTDRAGVWPPSCGPAGRGRRHRRGRGDCAWPEAHDFDLGRHAGVGAPAGEPTRAHGASASTGIWRRPSATSPRWPTRWGSRCAAAREWAHDWDWRAGPTAWDDACHRVEDRSGWRRSGRCTTPTGGRAGPRSSKALAGAEPAGPRATSRPAAVARLLELGARLER